MQLSVNTKLQNGKYRILRVLGQGGFGITYLAEHTMLDKMVAIKEFFPKEYCDRDESTSQVTIGLKNSSELVETLKTKFLKEAKNISKLDHPGIVKIFDIFQENGTAYYIMEYVEGESLSSKIKCEGAMSEANAINMLMKIASAISHIHGLSMTHLDIKPANIMIRAKDGDPILIDFGLSKQYDSAGGQTSTTPVGISHGYAPIEQYIPGGVSSFSPQTDIYALGATLFAMLTGKTPPHYGEILENGIPEYPSSVSDITKEAVEHALETKKQKRPQSVEEFLKHFEGFTPSDEKPLSVKSNDGDVIKTCIDTPKDFASKDSTPSVTDGNDVASLNSVNEHIESSESSDEETAILQTETLETNEEQALSPIVDTRVFPKISISQKRGMNVCTRDEIIEFFWSVSDAVSVYLLINGSKYSVSNTGTYYINNKNEQVKIVAIGVDEAISESEIIHI
ncbi:MAG: serine/threonine protein kinase [Muribaculaceae bacterium]|nr:serine/threonine protein kinase [Muribaculaceae bacterium]